MDSPVSKIEGTADPEFLESVLEGLSADPKFLSSRYFYDDKGDRLFQKIMASPEYYLTDCELEIFREQGTAIAREILKGGPCEIIELGSGDGQKVGYLLDALHQLSSDWIYRPADISSHSLELLAANLLPERPWLRLEPIHGNYMDLLESLEPGKVRRVFLFLGSNLGNFGVNGSIRFLRKIRDTMGPDDALVIGLDLKKEPEVILAAYNDASGHTRDFNLNLLERINKELGGDFDTDAFEHRPNYDPASGAAESFLVSTRSQGCEYCCTRTFFCFHPWRIDLHGNLAEI